MGTLSPSLHLYAKCLVMSLTLAAMLCCSLLMPSAAAAATTTANSTQGDTDLHDDDEEGRDYYFHRFSERYFHANKFAMWFRGESPPSTFKEEPSLPSAMWWLYGGIGACLLCVGAVCFCINSRTPAVVSTTPVPEDEPLLADHAVV